jgi:gamma-glutamyltranspeptidase/glutathione hydrolase
MTFDWQNPYPTVRAPIFARNIVATSQPLAAQAGLRILAAGGNAVDACIAAAATLALTDPIYNSLGSDCFAIVWDGARLHGLNASGRAPSAWNLNYFNHKHNGMIPMRGWDSVTVPGCVAGWATLHEKLGSLRFEDVLAPAIDYAERGFAVSPQVQQQWAIHASRLQSLPGFAEHFLPRGRVPAIGEHFVLKGAAETLKRIADSNGRDFYEGETAHKLVAHAQAYEAGITLADLHDYAPEWVTLFSQPYQRYTLHQPSPNGEDMVLLIALGILQHIDLHAQPFDHPDTQHLLIEVMKLAFAEIYPHGDHARSINVSPEQRLSPDYLASRAHSIDMRRAHLCLSSQIPAERAAYLTAVDRNGMMVSFTQSNYMEFGSGIVVPGTGINLQNRGYSFNLNPDHPNGVAGGKRPCYTHIPGFLMKDGAPIMSFGIRDGHIQPQEHLQTLVHTLDFGQQPQAACDAPRWKWNQGLSVDLEAEMPTAVLDSLQERGHLLKRCTDSSLDFGAIQLIWRLGDPAVDGYVAASDSRHDGLAAGF